MRCTIAQGGRESGVRASSGSMVAPSVARISPECGVRTRKADARWCVWGPRGSCACSGTVAPPLLLYPTPFPAIHAYIRVRGVCEQSTAVRAVWEGCCIYYSEGIRNMTAHAVPCILHDVAPMVEIRSELKRVRGVKSLGQTRSAGFIFIFSG